MLSPMIVLRRWPTCICLAMLGLEKSTTIVLGSAVFVTKISRGFVDLKQPVGQELCFEPQIDKPRPGNLGRLADIAQVQFLHDLFGEFARIGFQFLRQAHHAISLIIPKLRVLGRFDYRGTILAPGNCSHNCADPFFKYV